MFKWIIGAALLASATSAASARPASRPAASAKPPAKSKAAAKAKAAALMVCAVSQEAMAPDPKNSVQFNGKTVYFCCSDCKAEFARMSDAQKKAHVAAAQKLATKANTHA